MKKFIFIASSFRVAKNTVESIVRHIPNLTKECLADKLTYYNDDFSFSAQPIGDGSKLRGTDATFLFIDPSSIDRKLLKA